MFAATGPNELLRLVVQAVEGSSPLAHLPKTACKIATSAPPNAASRQSAKGTNGVPKGDDDEGSHPQDVSRAIPEIKRARSRTNAVASLARRRAG